MNIAVRVARQVGRGVADTRSEDVTVWRRRGPVVEDLTRWWECRLGDEFLNDDPNPTGDVPVLSRPRFRVNRCWPVGMKARCETHIQRVRLEQRVMSVLKIART